MDFIPFDASEEEVAARAVLRPGVPQPMRKPLTSWILSTMDTEHGYVYAERFHDLENSLDLDMNLNPAFTGLIGKEKTRRVLGQLNERDLLRVADHQLFMTYRPATAALEKVLRAGRSKWTVVQREGKPRLGERMPEGVRVAAEQVMTGEGAPGALLRKAWNKVHDLEPDDSGAYAAAVKAVEAAALPVLGIDKETATVADAVRAIEKRDASWRLPFLREHTEYPSRDVLLGMLKSLYRGQRDRHGSEAYRDVTHDEAEAAVLMAVTIVGFFSGGLVAERDTDAYQ